jgi:hypothetical protein
MSGATIASYGGDGQKDVCFSRMLKKSTSGVLASFRPSTYPRGYAADLHSLWPCWTSFLSILRGCSALGPDVQDIEVLPCRTGYSVFC